MNSVNPTFRGLVRTQADLLVVVEACLQGFLSHTPRKPSLEESNFLVQPWNTFVYEENASGFREWSDHFPWILVEREDDVEESMCIPFNLRKNTACVEWQRSTHFLVSYQPIRHSNATGLGNLWDYANIRNLTPRNGLCFKHENQTWVRLEFIFPRDQKQQ
jgi:hypothetical protein